MTQSSLLTLSEIAFGYGAAAGYSQIFSDLSLEILRGEVFSIVGPGGSGKTTLLKLMAGLFCPSRGKVLRHNMEREGLGMTFQNSGLFDGLSVAENLDLPLKESRRFPSSGRGQRIKAGLAEVGLPGIENRRISELSGGMRKRLAIARALILEPQLLLCDDPTAGLDPVTALQIDQMLVNIQRLRGMTVVLVTSQIGEAIRWSDRIGFLHQGKFIEIGSPGSIQESENPAVRQFVRGETEGPLTSPHSSEMSIS
jgi:phospholipid/cholesterol/gamma-HCH transport system ATP-binding protein